MEEEEAPNDISSPVAAETIDWRPLATSRRPLEFNHSICCRRSRLLFEGLPERALLEMGLALRDDDLA